MDTQPGEAWHRPPSQPAPSSAVLPHPGQVDGTNWQKRGRAEGGEESQNILCLELPCDVFQTALEGQPPRP